MLERVFISMLDLVAERPFDLEPDWRGKDKSLIFSKLKDLLQRPCGSSLRALWQADCHEFIGVPVRVRHGRVAG